MKNNKYIIPSVLLLVGLAGGFAGGYYFKTYQQTQQRNTFRNGSINGQRFNPNGQDSQRGGMFGGIGEGEVVSVDDKSASIKLPDGSSKIILFSDSTSFFSSNVAKRSDLKQGIKITVFGKSNTDGSITADKVQINPVK